MSKVAEVNQKIEPSFDAKLPEGVNRITKEEAERREYTLAGCDYGYFLLEFLRGQRGLEVQSPEITETQLYQRSNEMERKALRIVCEPDYPGEIRLPSPEETRMLQTRDAFIMSHVDGTNLGHGNLVAQLRALPARVSERQRFDAAMFRTTYEEPELFRWVWNR